MGEPSTTTAATDLGLTVQFGDKGPALRRISRPPARRALSHHGHRGVVAGRIQSPTETSFTHRILLKNLI